ncbi:MAG: S8 family serine peptidase, partial [Anaerolineales bacterium]|nr:S8 family serine peptidase [Anaerolineales bacterium]
MPGKRQGLILFSMAVVLAGIICVVVFHPARSNPALDIETDYFSTRIKPLAPPNAYISDNSNSQTDQNLLQKQNNVGLLRHRLKNTNHIRVIVGLDIPYQTEGSLSSPREILDQRTLIKNAQDRLIDRLAPFDVDVTARFQYIPFIGLAVDSGALEDLVTNPNVTSVVEDIPMPPILDSSIPVIGADAAWAAGYSGSGQTIAILDTGVDSSHSFLSGKVVSEACYSTTDPGDGSTTLCPGGGEEETGTGTGINCNTSIYGCDHGTHVAGIAAGRGSSFSGVAKNANIIAIQVFSEFTDPDCTNSGYPSSPCALSYPADQILGLERVYSLNSSFNIAAINVSIGSGQYLSLCDGVYPAYKAAIDNLRGVNIPTIIATGNDGYTNATAFPACISSAFSVGASTDSDNIWTGSNISDFVSYIAPGHSINSSVPGGGFDNWNGTSMAAPHVSGTWAVLKSKNPDASILQVSSTLRRTGKSIDDTRPGGAASSLPRIQLDDAAQILPPHCGTITSDETWTSEGNVHTVSCDVAVAPGATLTIEEGTIVKFHYNKSLIINGSLRVLGTGGNPIYFTSIRDDTIGGDTNGDGWSTGARGDWRRIEFTDTSDDSTSIIDHAIVRFG